MTKISTLVFDWHGVLDFVTFESLTKKLSALTQLSVDDIKKTIHSEERLYAAGQLEPVKFWQQVQSLFSLSELQIDKLKTYILSCDLNHELWNYLETLKGRYTLAILSDCPKDKLEVIRTQTDLTLFKTTHFSYEKHILKNDDTFFLKLVHELEVTPEECLYIDDSERHITTATRLNFQTCLFKTINDLKKYV